MNFQSQIAELRKEMPPDWQWERRIDYLKDRMSDVIIDAWHTMELHEDYVRRNRLVEMILTQEALQELLKGILKMQGELLTLRKSSLPGRKDITPEMIDRARAFPFTELYEFKRNTALCPFHEDHDPSFVLMKDNRARCFGACGKSWDTIAFVMDRDGLKFPEAVRQLQ